MTRKTTPGHIRISDEMYERLHPSGEPTLVGTSPTLELRYGRPTWKLYVSTALVEQMGEGWHGPVEFKFQPQPSGELDMMFRRLEL